MSHFLGAAKLRFGGCHFQRFQQILPLGRAPSLHHIGKRIASSVAAKPPECTLQWCAVIHDNPHSLQKRLAVRETHLKRVTSTSQTLIGGAILDAPGDAGKMCGSMMVFEAATREDAEAFLQNDPYYTNGVWKDWTLFPLRLAPVGLAAPSTSKA
eukprot:TRINITY_DN11030_c0_g1_i1.p1 TRINITY_DN11030_c0_g1~~TRINITY_DN11030_c0_g1_i1.p1  ORF type:complete len:155 (-),score=15.44 TRINITY_DN11030_c0_g1_i1:442-906(-)